MQTSDQPALKGTSSSDHPEFSTTAVDDQITSVGGIHHQQPTRQPNPRRTPVRGRPLIAHGESIANADIRDLVLVHINVHAPSPPGTMDSQERSLTPIPEVESDSDSVRMPRSASPDSYVGSVRSRGTLESGASWIVDDAGPGERDDHAPVYGTDTGSRGSRANGSHEQVPYILTSSPAEVFSPLPEIGASTREVSPCHSANHVGHDPAASTTPLAATPVSVSVDRQAESATTLFQSLLPHPYTSQRRHSSRQSSSGSSIYATRTVVSDGRQPVRTSTYPLVVRSEQAIVSPQQRTQLGGAAGPHASHLPPSQVMAHPNYSHYMIYQSPTTAFGINIGTPFQTPRQHRLSLAPHPMDPVPVNGAYVSSTAAGPDSNLLGFPSQVSGAAVPDSSLHIRSSSNCSSTTAAVDQHAAPPGPWDPQWTSFSLAVWRKAEHDTIHVKPGWDDEDLVRELKKTYDGLRSWRRILSLKGPRYLTRVHWQGEPYIYPQRVGPERLTAHRTMRIQFLLKHPERMRGKHVLMHELTRKADVGIEFVEQWKVWRVAFMVFMLAFVSMVIAIVTSIRLNDWSTGFAIGGFFAQMFAVILVAIGFVHYEEL